MTGLSESGTALHVHRHGHQCHRHRAGTRPVEPGEPRTGPTAPGAPTAVSATAGDGSATVTWTAPVNGGSPLTRYTVTPLIGGIAQAAVDVTGSPLPTSTTVTGLTNGTAYTFTVTATNAIGTGPASARRTR